MAKVALSKERVRRLKERAEYLRAKNGNHYDRAELAALDWAIPLLEREILSEEKMMAHIQKLIHRTSE